MVVVELSGLAVVFLGGLLDGRRVTVVDDGFLEALETGLRCGLFGRWVVVGIFIVVDGENPCELEYTWGFIGVVAVYTDDEGFFLLVV